MSTENTSPNNLKGTSCSQAPQGADVLKGTDDRSLDEIYQVFIESPAPIAVGDGEIIDAKFVGIEYRRTRRAALAMLGLSGQRLITMVTEDRATAVAMAEAAASIEDYVGRLREFADMMNTAGFRIRAALCNREDMDAVLADAEREGGQSG